MAKKSLGIWLEVFRKQSVAIEGKFTLSQASDQVSDDVVAEVRKLVRGMVFHLNFGVEVLRDVASIRPSAPRLSLPLDAGGRPLVFEGAKKVVVMEESSVWWTKKNRHGIFLDHVRRVFGLDEKEPAAGVVKKVCRVLGLKVSKVPKKLLANGAAKLIVEALENMELGEDERELPALKPEKWLGDTVHGNLSHLVSRLEVLLGRVKPGKVS